MLRSRSGGGQRAEENCGGGRGSNGQSALLTTDKDGYLWVMAQSSCLPQGTLSPTDKIKYKSSSENLEKSV